jgi:hypothetical protein
MRQWNKQSDVEFINPQREENDILARLDNSYMEISETSNEEREFLNALILRNKPQKLLEIGVSQGGTSIVMLNAIKDFANAKLYSIDLYTNWYKNVELKTGYFVDRYPQLKNKWNLYTGGLALKFMDEIIVCCGWGGV